MTIVFESLGLLPDSVDELIILSDKQITYTSHKNKKLTKVNTSAKINTETYSLVRSRGNTAAFSSMFTIRHTRFSS